MGVGADGARGWAAGLKEGSDTRPQSTQAMKSGAERLSRGTLVVGVAFSAWGEFSSSRKSGASTKEALGRAGITATFSGLGAWMGAATGGTAGAAAGAACGSGIEVCAPVFGAGLAVGGGIAGGRFGETAANRVNNWLWDD